MEQGSVDWLAWRQQGIGSSDAPAIMEVSPYKTRLQLAEEKLGLREGQKTHAGMRRGNELEPMARAAYELENDLDAPPALFQSEQYPFLRASLDGWNAEKKKVLEIKCPNAVDHEMAKRGKVPEKYWVQMQHQFMVCNAESGDYWSFDGVKGVKVEVLPDLEYQKKLLKAELEFWALIQKKELPEPGPKDFVQVDDHHAQILFENYSDIERKLKELEAQKEQLREIIVGRFKGQRVYWKNVKAYPVLRKGTVDYSKIPALEGVDTEPFRKAPTQTMTLAVAKDSKK